MPNTKPLIIESNGLIRKLLREYFGGVTGMVDLDSVLVTDNPKIITLRFFGAAPLVCSTIRNDYPANYVCLNADANGDSVLAVMVSPLLTAAIKAAVYP